MKHESSEPSGRGPADSVADERQPATISYAPSQPARGLLWKLGLHRPELRAWAMYDWANSAFVTTITTAVFPIYFTRVARGGLSKEAANLRYATATAIGLAIIAILSPILGAMTDFRPIKKRMLGSFLAMGVVATSLMFFIGEGDWVLAAVLFVVSNIAVNGSFVFYDALLPHVAREDEIDRVSTAGYALGYVGGGVLLALQLACISKPEWFGLPEGTLPTRLSFVSVSVWWLLFSIPLFRRVPEPKVRIVPPPVAPASIGNGTGQPAVVPTGRDSALRAALIQLRGTFRSLRGYRNGFLMLIGFLIYNDGIGTIQRMAAPYGEEIGIGSNTMIAAILLTQFVGIPFAFLFGSIAGKIGAKRSIFLGLGAYTFIAIFGYFMKTDAHFLILAVLVGIVQGGTQALSRSLFASLIPRHQSGEFFGFFAVVEKFAGIFGPAVFAAVIYMTGTSRSAILSVIAFFVVGGWLLLRVNVEEGQRVAREAEARARPTGTGA